MRDTLAIPFGWVLSGLYGLTDSYVLSILLLTIVVRLLLLPASISQQKNQAKQVRLNTKVNKIKTKSIKNAVILFFIEHLLVNIFNYFLPFLLLQLQ